MVQMRTCRTSGEESPLPPLLRGARSILPRFVRGARSLLTPLSKGGRGDSWIGFTRLLLIGILLLTTACSGNLDQALKSFQAASATPVTAPTGTAPPSTITPTAQNTVTPQPTPKVDPLWVGNEADGNVLVIDANANAVTAVIPSGITPSQVVTGEGAAWVLDRVSNKLARINLESYRIEALIPIPKGQASALAVGEGAVWVGITEPPDTLILNPFEDFEPQGGVLRFDPTSNGVTAYVQTGPVLNLTIGAGALWVLVKGKVDTPVQKVDPRTLGVQPVQLAGTADWLLDDSLAAGLDSLWLYSQAFGKLYRTNFSGHLYAEVSFGQGRPQGPASILIENDEVWVATPWGSVARVDPADGKIVSQVDVGAPLSELKAAGGAVWALSPMSATAYRIDPVSNQVTARVATGSKAAPTPYITPTPIQRATRPCDPGPFSRLSVGMRAYTLKEPPLPQRLHKEAGKDKERAGWIQPGETVKILEGPVCADQWVWWRVETETGHATGWAAEGDETGYWLNPMK